MLLNKYIALFEPGRVLHGYDGLEFDAVNATVVRTNKKSDTDGDGLGDNGYENGLNVYGIGLQGSSINHGRQDYSMLMLDEATLPSEKGKPLDIRDNALTVTVPMGILRVIDIEHR
jgi:hypothetical protein